MKDNSIFTYLRDRFAVHLSRGCPVTSKHPETAELSSHNFLGIITTYKSIGAAATYRQVLNTNKHLLLGKWKCKLTWSIPLIFPYKSIVYPTILNARLCANERHYKFMSQTRICQKHPTPHILVFVLSELMENKNQISVTYWLLCSACLIYKANELLCFSPLK